MVYSHGTITAIKIIKIEYFHHPRKFPYAHLYSHAPLPFWKRHSTPIKFQPLSLYQHRYYTSRRLLWDSLVSPLDLRRGLPHSSEGSVNVDIFRVLSVTLVSFLSCLSLLLPCSTSAFIYVLITLKAFLPIAFLWVLCIVSVFLTDPSPLYISREPSQFSTSKPDLVPALSICLLPCSFQEWRHHNPRQATSGPCHGPTCRWLPLHMSRSHLSRCISFSDPSVDFDELWLQLVFPWFWLSALWTWSVGC